MKMNVFSNRGLDYPVFHFLQLSRLLQKWCTVVPTGIDVCNLSTGELSMQSSRIILEEYAGICWFVNKAGSLVFTWCLDSSN